MTTRLDRQVAHLVELCQRPEYAGRTWTWVSIATALDCTVGQANAVVRYMRENFDGWVWTVGTYRTDYVTMPTTSVIQALPGLCNQLRHMVTRDRTMARQWEILAKLEPDPRYAKIAERSHRWCLRRAEESTERLETLDDLLVD